MTEDAGETNRLLIEILRAIKDLDRNFKSQEKRLDYLENAKEPKEGFGNSGFEIEDVLSSQTKVLPDSLVMMNLEEYPHRIRFDGRSTLT